MVLRLLPLLVIMLTTSWASQAHSTLSQPFSRISLIAQFRAMPSAILEWMEHIVLEATKMGLPRLSLAIRAKAFLQFFVVASIFTLVHPSWGLIHLGWVEIHCFVLKPPKFSQFLPSKLSKAKLNSSIDFSKAEITWSIFHFSSKKNLFLAFHRV